MRYNILLVAFMASSGLTAPAAGGPIQLSPTIKRTVGERGLHYADISADDDAILYRWAPACDSETEKKRDPEVICARVQG
ncbi:hypothetical protein VSDG_06361 [Cytospora chrysosperma]|uniref:Uncharacterized protein n=1 Tax=Cytospora chrysosperma TaxID=252740 RepID=A0A423VPI3_CYTCH|nr:hypothetical protein VSDG_06361 [Valsa sordida]